MALRSPRQLASIRHCPTTIGCWPLVRTQRCRAANALDGPAPPRGEPVGDLLLVLFGEPDAQAILQLDTRLLVAAVLQVEAQHQLIKLLVYILA